MNAPHATRASAEPTEIRRTPRSASFETVRFGSGRDISTLTGFGATAFVGFGHVAPTFGDIFEARVLPAGGLGVRYQLTQKYPMHMRFDYSWGNDGPLLYFGVAEAF